MFLSGLSDSTKSASLGLAKKMIAADDVVRPEEAEMLRDVALEMELDPDIDPPETSVAELCAAVSDPRARASILLELASFAHVDSEYADSERALLASVASEWSIDPLTVVRVEAWAEQRIKVTLEAAEIVQEISTH